jgi:hypothetical protein
MGERTYVARRFRKNIKSVLHLPPAGTTNILPDRGVTEERSDD